MTDVIALARERRAKLAAEIDRLDDFIHTAELLLKYSSSKASAASSDDDDRGGRPERGMVHPIPRG